MTTTTTTTFQVHCERQVGSDANLTRHEVLFEDLTHEACVGFIETLIAGSANSAFQFNGEGWLEEKHPLNARVGNDKSNSNSKRKITYIPLQSTEFLKRGLSNFNEYFEIIWLDSKGKDVTPYIEYSCPSCKKVLRELGEDRVKENEHLITSKESYRVELRHVGHEMLTCDCGKVLSWYEAKMEEK